MAFSAGEHVTRDGDIVDLVVAVDGGGYQLRALFLGKRFAVDMVRPELEGYRLATDADRERARAYARRFNDEESDEALSAWMHIKGGAAMKKRKLEQLSFSFEGGSASAPFSAGTGAKGERKRGKVRSVPGQVPAVASPPPRELAPQSVGRCRAGRETARQRARRAYGEASAEASRRAGRRAKT